VTAPITVDIDSIGSFERFALTIPGDGALVFRGWSGTGKTTAMVAMVWCLYGTGLDGTALDRGWIRDGADAGSVTITIGDVVMHRRVTRSGTWTRTITTAGTPAVYTTEAGYVAALPAPLRDAAVVRAVMVPMAWRAMEASPGGGRELRDLLASLGAGRELRDIVHDLAEGAWRDGDHTDAAQWGTSRTAAVKALDHAEGAAGAHRSTADTPRPPAPEAIPRGDAHLLEWGRWIDAWGHVDGATYTEAHAVWQGSAPEPLPDEVHLRRAHSAAAMAKATWIAAAEAHTEARAAYRARGPDRAGMPCGGRTLYEPGDGDAVDCATCPAWASAGDEPALLAAGTAAGAAAKGAAVAMHAADDVVCDLAAARARALAALASWRALEPRRPAVPATPAGDRPEIAEVSRARRRATAHQQATSDRAAHLRGAEAAAAAATKADGAVVVARAAVERCTAMLAACRAAPTVQAREVVAALGDLGPVAIVLGGGTHASKDPAVRVMLCGRPWMQSSTGERIVGDAWLRVALRRVAGLEDVVPLWVDEVQSAVGVAAPDLGRAVVLITTDTPLEVS